VAYTNVWSSTAPLGSVSAATLDDELRKVRKDIEERLDTLIGQANFSGATDPVIDGTTIKDLKVLTSQITTINSTNGYVPKRASATAFSNSIMSEAGTTISVGGALNISTALSVGTTATLNGVTYTWPGSQAAGYVLQTNGSGTLSWVSMAAAGGLTGSGVTGKLPVWAGSGVLGDSGIGVSGGAISSVAGITASGGISTTSGMTAGSMSASGYVSATLGINVGTFNNATFETNAIGSERGVRLIIQGGSAFPLKFVIDDDDASSGLYVDDTINEYKVVGKRRVGWSGGMAGTAARNFTSTYGPGTASGTYTQAELQGVMDSLKEVSEKMKAVLEDLIAHGLIGS
jgi:hypothetical protein